MCGVASASENIYISKALLSPPISLHSVVENGLATSQLGDEKTDKSGPTKTSKERDLRAKKKIQKKSISSDEGEDSMMNKDIKLDDE